MVIRVDPAPPPEPLDRAAVEAVAMVEVEQEGHREVARYEREKCHHVTKYAA